MQEYIRITYGKTERIFIFFLTFRFYRNIIEKNSLPKVINMSLAFSRVKEYFFSFSVAFYFSYAYFAMEKLLVRVEKSF